MTSHLQSFIYPLGSEQFDSYSRGPADAGPQKTVYCNYKKTRCVGGEVLAMNIGHNRLYRPQPKQTRVNMYIYICGYIIDRQAGK